MGERSDWLIGEGGKGDKKGEGGDQSLPSPIQPKGKGDGREGESSKNGGQTGKGGEGGRKGHSGLGQGAHQAGCCCGWQLPGPPPPSFPPSAPSWTSPGPSLAFPLFTAAFNPSPASVSVMQG